MPKKTKSIKATDIKAGKAWLKKVSGYQYPVDTIERNAFLLFVKARPRNCILSLSRY